MKQEFPALKKIAYLDNAATTQKPLTVINKIKEFYEEKNANPKRGIYELSVKATEELENAREETAKFLNAETKEIFFVKNTTDGLNMLARSLEEDVDTENNVVTTIMEHHSNFVPWLELTKRKKAKLQVAKEPIEENILSLVNEKTKIVTFSAMSNVSGRKINAEKIIKKIKEKNKECKIIIDAAQSIAHEDIDVKKINCDFLVFSAHKVYGPLGVGVVYGKKEELKKMPPSSFGGGMIADYEEEFTYEEVPHRFETGTIDVANISGLREAIRFFKTIKNKFETEQELKDFALRELRKIDGIKIIGHEDTNYGPVISFTLNKIHPHDLASIADSFNVCIRAGHQCAKPYIKYLGLDSVTRASISFYNDKEDIMKLIDAIKKAKVIFDE